MGKTFGFVVLHYLADEATISCVDHLLALDLAPEERTIVVVDNGSHNGSLERLQAHFASEPHVHVLPLDENLGFARGNNEGFRYLMTQGTFSFVVALNNDLMIEDRTFAHKVSACYDAAPFGLLGPDVVTAAGTHQSPQHHLPLSLDELTSQIARYEQECADFDQWWEQRTAEPVAPQHRMLAHRMLARLTPRRVARGLVRRARGALGRGRSFVRRLVRQEPRQQEPTPSAVPIPPHEIAAENVALHGSCLVFGPSLFKRGYLFNPATFLYFEEDILAYECLRDGIRILYEPTIKVLHLEDVATARSLPHEKERERLKHREKLRSMNVLLEQMQTDVAAEAQRNVMPAAGVQAQPLTALFAGNSINGAAFRRAAVTTHYDSAGIAHTFVSYVANAQGLVCVARRSTANHTWAMTTVGTLNACDAHNAVSLEMDGTGTVHVMWSDHNGALTHLVSTEPYGLAFTDDPIEELTGEQVTYPQLFRQPSGSLLLLYRSGRAGSGSLVLYRLEMSGARWQCCARPLIDGADAESPYAQACLDEHGRLHLSWTWRQSSDASSNHDLYYAVATDERCCSFVSTQGEVLPLPLRLGEGELVWRVPCGSSLLNQNSMTVDGAGNPVICSLWRSAGVFQHHLLGHDEAGWHCLDTHLRTSDYLLSGRGTQALPCARPLVLPWPGTAGDVLLLMRDAEVQGRVELARLSCTTHAARLVGRWPLTLSDVGAWEPTIDQASWQREGRLRLLVQHELAWPDNRQPLPALSEAVLLEVDPVSLAAWHDKEEHA